MQDSIIKIDKTADNSTACWAKCGDFGFCLDVYDDGTIILVAHKGEKMEYIEIQSGKSTLDKPQDSSQSHAPQVTP